MSVYQCDINMKTKTRLSIYYVKFIQKIMKNVKYVNKKFKVI